MIDRHSDTWVAIERWLMQRRESCVLSLINGTSSDDKLRGQIRTIDDLLDFSSEDKPPADQPDD